MCLNRTNSPRMVWSYDIDGFYFFLLHTWFYALLYSCGNEVFSIVCGMWWYNKILIKAHCFGHMLLWRGVSDRTASDKGAPFSSMGLSKTHISIVKYLHHNRWIHNIFTSVCYIKITFSKQWEIKGCQNINPTFDTSRVGFLPGEMYFFQDAWKKLEEIGRN